MERQLKMLSLFDGSGGFPLAGKMCGVEPVACSEVDPYPIAVTRSRFPSMKHLGSVTDVNGGEVEPVDVITFGSPCQDLSIAGKRAGLKHEENGDNETTRSGLFMEAVRIIKEMRKKTNGVYPRFAVWENVPGAFSSNKGEDFRTVLNEFVKIAEPEAPEVPAPGKNGWPYADILVGDGWSIAYRVLDAPFWGVPQRRRRIYLVADFRGQRAGEVLFKRKGLRGHFETGRTAWQRTAGYAKNRTGAADSEEHSLTPYLLKIRSGCEGGGKGALVQENKSATLSTNNDQYLFQPMGVDGYNATITGQVSSTLTGDRENRITDYTSVVIEPVPCTPINDKATRWRGGGASRNHDGSGNGLGIGADGDPSPTPTAGDRNAVAYATKARDYKDATDLVVEQTLAHYIVRRLTPTECARLQGFPDEWGHPEHKDDFTDEEYQFWLTVRNTHAAINGKAEKEYSKAQMLTWYNKLHTDSSEYKMWGNGVALPCVLYVMQGVSEVLRDGTTA